jgi:MarR family transcriptional regulator, transcriptional regulator for hemolysin
MRKIPPRRQFAFLLNDVARMLRTCADHAVRPYGMTRAQWAVLARLERCEGLKQSELAELLDIQPITLTRLIDRLCDSGMIERRADPHDRRAKRLHLTAAAKPVLDQLWSIGNDIMAEVLDGLEDNDIARTVTQLNHVKENLRSIIDHRTSVPTEQHPHHA